MGDVEKYLVEQVASPIVSSKSCKIIYGYKPGCLDNILDSLVILIEPRTDRIDQIQSLKRKDFILIKKNGYLQ